MNPYETPEYTEDDAEAPTWFDRNLGKVSIFGAMICGLAANTILFKTNLNWVDNYSILACVLMGLGNLCIFYYSLTISSGAAKR